MDCKRASHRQDSAAILKLVSITERESPFRRTLLSPRRGDCTVLVRGHDGRGCYHGHEYLGVIDRPNESILSRRRGDAQYVRELLWR